MYLFDFQNKLKKLNPLLYVYSENVNRVSAGVFVTGIYLKQPKRERVAEKANLNYASDEQKKLLLAASEGKDAFITGVSTNFVPEYDIYDLDRERMLMPGWRTILLTIVEKGICPLDRAKKVFKCSSLGESDWDNLKFPQRLQWAKGDRPERKFK